MQKCKENEANAKVLRFRGKREFIFETEDGFMFSAFVVDKIHDDYEKIDEVRLDDYELYVEKGHEWRSVVVGIDAIKK